MDKTAIIGNMIFDFNKKLASVKSTCSPNKDYIDTFLYPCIDGINKQIQEIDIILQKSGEIHTENYDNLIARRKNLLTQQESFLEDIQKEEAKLHLSPEELDKIIKEQQEKIKCEFIQTLTDELKNIETQITDKNCKSKMDEEQWEDLINAKALCEIKLDELKENNSTLELPNEIQNPENPPQQKEPEEFENPVSSTKANESVTPSSQENFSNPPDYEITDDMNGTITRIHSTPQNNRKSENSDYEIIDDMEQARKSEEDTQEKESIGKDINIYISEKNGFVQYTDKEGKKLELSISSIKEEKPNTYKRIPINKMCKKVAGNRLQGAYLSHKISPILIKILDSTGNNQMIYDYIESIHNHQPLPFNLYHDLSGLTEIEKWKLQRFTKSEEKCGAEIIKDSEVKLLFEQKPEKTKKRNTDFIPKVDGNHEEIAKKHNEQKRPQDFFNRQSQHDDFKGV